VRRQAIQFGSVAPIVLGSRPDWMKGTWRNELTTYLATYAEEARERGLPLIHALPLQFSKDVEAGKVNDEFMLGDELLIAPMYRPKRSRSVYLPMGIWTRLSDNQVFQGKRTVKIEAGPGEMPVFSRNGAILPLGSEPMKLHYFPRLGGEFFLFESEMAEYSQVHAGPAGDFMRLEIESKKDRDYEWIVHHLEQPRKVVAAGVELPAVEMRDRLRPRAWFYDAKDRNLHVRIKGRADGDEIVNISF
jgi:alpha-glucosidase (family GH31 glycosyl hydrolase)